MARMNYAAKQQKAEPLPVGKMLVLVLLLILCVGAGYAFIRRQQWVEQQRNLYQQYLAFNAWRPGIKPIYDSDFPLLNEAEAVPMDRPDLAEVARLESEIVERKKVLEALPDGGFGTNAGRHEFPQELSDLLQYHLLYLAHVRALNSPVSNPKVRLEDADMAVEWDVHISKDERTLPAVRVLEQRNALLEDRALKAKAKLGLGVDYALLRSTTIPLEQFIDKPEFLPAGLDLEFARKLPPPSEQ